MNEALRSYLIYRHRCDVENKPVQMAAVAITPDMIPDIEAELARIAALRLGAHLPNRDFESHMNKIFCEEALAELKVSGRLKASEGGGDTVKVDGTTV